MICLVYVFLVLKRNCSDLVFHGDKVCAFPKNRLKEEYLIFKIEHDCMLPNFLGSLLAW